MADPTIIDTTSMTTRSQPVNDIIPQLKIILKMVEAHSLVTLKTFKDNLEIMKLANTLKGNLF